MSSSLCGRRGCRGRGRRGRARRGGRASFALMLMGVVGLGFGGGLVDGFGVVGRVGW